MWAETGGCWVSEWISVSGRSDTASDVWSSFHCSFQTARTQNPYRKHFSHENNFFLCSEQKHLHFQLLFSAKMTNANFHQTPQLLLEPLMIYWEKEKVIWCVRWEEGCVRSDMGTGVRPVLFNGRRHFWLTLSTYANLETAHTHTQTQSYFCSDTHTYTACMKSE